MPRFAACWALGMLACAQAQMPSNVGGDGIDRAAAAEALGAIERTACSEAGGPAGKVLVSVVFAPDGNVTEAKFDKGQDKGPGSNDAAAAIAGTPRGQCLLARLRDLHVPAFRGAPTKVGRLLTLE